MATLPCYNNERRQRPIVQARQQGAHQSGRMLVDRERRQAIRDDQSAVEIPMQLFQMQARIGAEATPQIWPPQILRAIPHRTLDDEAIQSFCQRMRLERQMNRVPSASMSQLKIEHLLHRNAVPGPTQTHPSNSKPPKLLHTESKFTARGNSRRLCSSQASNSGAGRNPSSARK
jgi:hypothetical protein